MVGMGSVRKYVSGRVWKYDSSLGTIIFMDVVHLCIRLCVRQISMFALDTF